MAITNVASWKRQRVQRRLIEAGLCVRCAAPRDGSSMWRCLACAEKNRTAIRHRQRGRRARGECVRCGAPAGGRAYCGLHSWAGLRDVPGNAPQTRQDEAGGGGEGPGP